MKRLGICLAAVAIIVFGPGAAGTPAVKEHPRLIVDLGPQGRLGSFRPDQVLGAAIDGAEAGDIDRLFTTRNVKAMKSAGLRPLTYRLRTELGIETWHWNPIGNWSDPARSQGYWTSSDRLGPPISLSWGYKLPRRGDTVDNANNAGYSRLTDGDEKTFWKSNPYLDPKLLHDGQPHHQWLMVKLDRAAPIDTAIIDWAIPWATSFDVQYWNKPSQYDPDGNWVTFPHGAVRAGRGGRLDILLADAPVTVQCIRVLMLSGSGTAPAGSTDWRDRAGVAVREIALGARDRAGVFHDLIHHRPDRKTQTFTHVSSTDPWHRAGDRDADLEQVGIDRFFASGLGAGSPAMMPAGLLFDTPENMAAELRYLKQRRYPVRQIELGEEPDGQYGAASDYGALFLAAVDRLRPIAPGMIFGGPSQQSALTQTWMDPASHGGAWAARLIAYLKQRKRLRDLGFFSFEYYPFDDICGDINAKLIAQDRRLDEIARQLDADGVPRATPRIISEYGFSAYSGRAMVEMPSALLMANIVGQWLTLGGKAAYMFGYGPNVPVNQHQPCAGYGDMMLFLADAEGQATQPMPSYYTARLLTQLWTVPGGGRHQLYRTETAGLAGEQVRMFALRQPGGKLALLILNRSATESFAPTLASRTGAAILPLKGPAEIDQYSPADYQWLDQGEKSHPTRDQPPSRTFVRSGALAPLLPPDSVTVVVMR